MERTLPSLLVMWWQLVQGHTLMPQTWEIKSYHIFPKHYVNEVVICNLQLQLSFNFALLIDLLILFILIATITTFYIVFNKYTWESEVNQIRDTAEFLSRQDSNSREGWKWNNDKRKHGRERLFSLF